MLASKSCYPLENFCVNDKEKSACCFQSLPKYFNVQILETTVSIFDPLRYYSLLFVKKHHLEAVAAKRANRSGSNLKGSTKSLKY